MKIAIVCSGGGMRCAYSAGVLYALATKYKYTSPDVMIAASGSAGSAACYLAGGYEEMKTIWTELLSTPKFISYLRLWRIIDVNYLIDGVLKRQLPAGVQMLSRSKTKYYIPVRNTKSHVLRYISNDDDIDIFETLRAAKALPFLFRGKITLQDEDYIDGGFGLPFEDLMEKAKILGATQIIAIDNRRSIRKLREFQQYHPENIALISNTTLPLRLLTHNKKSLSQTFKLGFNDALQNEELRKLLQSLN